MSKYLLEIGTEELPYKFIPQAVEQLKANFENFFEVNAIKFGSIDVYATPRRLAVIVSDLLNKQPDEEKVVRGPIEKIAYENGKLTNAALGFSRKCGVEEKDLFLQDGYLHAKVFTKGKLTSELLQENVAQIVLKLQGPHFMRWGSFDEKFSRPVRWIVSILDDKEIPVQIVDAKSSIFTRGHRFSRGKCDDAGIIINNVDEYIDKLKGGHVIVNQNERKELIVNLTKKEADKLGAVASYDEDLLDEVTYLCEYPIPVVCDFKERYLDIPEKVTVTVMASHQRYFALFKNGKLLNKFITITNYIGNDFSNIKAGNERVITARLDDAIFFFKEDTKKPFETYVEKLKGMTFQKGMGSVYDKTQRVVDLSKTIASELGVKSPDVERTALLCKADLATSLVFEFTELQGYIGADYARISGENEKVCKGIKEHYFPLNAESELAEGIEGQIVGIADKLDTICAVFLGGRIPTGSSDPLGVRRAALGIIKTILEKNLNLDLSKLIKLVLKNLNSNSDKEKVFSQIEEFFVQRLIIFMAESYRKDILEACSKNGNPLVNLCDFVDRVKLISENIEKPEFLKLNESANRITRILGANSLGNPQVDISLLQIDAEKQLFSQIEKIESLDELLESNYTNLITNLVLINPAIEKFFEDVLVMDKNEKIKQNRLAMLSILKKKYDLLADFSALQI